MGFTKRMVTVLMVLAVVAASCSDDPESDQAIVDDIVDELIDESAEPDPEPDPVDEVTPDPEPDPVPEPDPEPDVPVLETTDACLWLYHYSHDLWPGFPYYAIIFGELPDGSYSTIEVSNPQQDLADFRLNEFGGTSGFDIFWPVAAPGPVTLPTVVIDGTDITQSMSAAFFGGISEFTAASAGEIDDEQIVPVPCTIEILHQVGKVVG